MAPGTDQIKLTINVGGKKYNKVKGIVNPEVNNQYIFGVQYGISLKMISMIIVDNIELNRNNRIEKSCMNTEKLNQQLILDNWNK
tara:strand:+ start:334 stop:588 length:255 start_codon:yes stop_codon:yes gene_type:complete